MKNSFITAAMVAALLFMSFSAGVMTNNFFDGRQLAQVGKNTPELLVAIKGGLDYTPPYQDDFGSVYKRGYSVKVIDRLEQQDELEKLCPKGFVLDHQRTRSSVRAELLCYTNSKESLARVSQLVAFQESLYNQVVVSNGEFFWQPKAGQFSKIQKAKGNKVVAAIKDSRPHELDFEARYSKSEFQDFLNKEIAELLVPLKKELTKVKYDIQRQDNNELSWG